MIRLETLHRMDHAVFAGIGAFLAGYVVGALPVAWLLVRRRHGVDMRARGSGGTGSLDAIAVAGVKTALIAVALEVVKGAAIGVAARLYTDSGWFIATAIAGCVAGDAFPIGFRRGGRGLVPLVAGLLVALPAAGLITAIIAVPTALFTSMRGSGYDAVVLVAVPVGLLVGTREWQSLGPAAAIVVVLLARSNLRRRRQAALSRRPDWRTIVDVDPSPGAAPPLGQSSRQNAGPWDS